MSYPINSKINPYMQPSTGLSSQQLQEIDAEKIKQGVNQGIDSNPVTQIVKNDTLVKTGLTVGIWFGIAQLMNKFNKACSTASDGSKNLLDKVRDFGDKIGEYKFFKSKAFENAVGFGEKVKTFLRKNVVDKSAVLRAFVDTPTKPKNAMARVMSLGTIGEIGQDTAQAFEQFVDISKKNNIDGLKELNLTADELAKISKEPDLYIDKIIDICKKKKPTEFIELANADKAFVPFPYASSIKKVFRDKLLGKELYSKLFGRRIYFSELGNKLTALKGVKGNYGKTYLGKSLPKTFLRTMEGLTNGTAGGKMMILMQAGFLADAIINTFKAPKGEKFKTFMENMTQNLAMYLTIPLGIKLIHHLGGLKYIGMSKDGIENYRNALTEFNKKAEAGAFASKAEYNQAKKALSNMLKGDTKLLKADGFGKNLWKGIKNIVHKPLKWGASIVSVGLETKSGLLKPGASRLENVYRNFGSLFKRGAGFPVRFILGMMVFIPFFSNLAVKACHVVFGRPTKSVLDEGKETEKAKETKTPQTIAIPQQQTPPQSTSAMQPIQNTNLANNQATPIQRENLIDMHHSNPEITPMHPIERENLLDMHKTEPTNPKVIPSPQEPVRTYVPSSDGVKINSNLDKEQDDKVSAAFHKADIAEKVANKYVHG